MDFEEGLQYILANGLLQKKR